ncbi:MAG: hypothetical protein HC880_20355 [Bacteroidia bacterium]|nr:hypothetical protein [Bacteroidia bacterium]
MLVCKKCKKIVPKSEVKQIIPGRGKHLHIYDIMENYYKPYQDPKKIVVGFSPVTRRIYCGEVEEVPDETQEEKDSDQA